MDAGRGLEPPTAFAEGGAIIEQSQGGSTCPSQRVLTNAKSGQSPPRVELWPQHKL